MPPGWQPQPARWTKGRADATLPDIWPPFRIARLECRLRRPAASSVAACDAQLPALPTHISRSPRRRMSRLSAAKASASLGSQVSSTPARKFMPCGGGQVGQAAVAAESGTSTQDQWLRAIRHAARATQQTRRSQQTQALQAGKTAPQHAEC